MMVFISAQIRRKEFGRKVPAEDLPVITRSARTALGVPIAARGLPPHTQLIKAYATKGVESLWLRVERLKANDFSIRAHSP